MKIKQYFYSFLSVLTLLVSLTGCGTVTEETKQDILAKKLLDPNVPKLQDAFKGLSIGNQPTTSTTTFLVLILPGLFNDGIYYQEAERRIVTQLRSIAPHATVLSLLTKRVNYNQSMDQLATEVYADVHAFSKNQRIDLNKTKVLMFGESFGGLIGTVLAKTGKIQQENILTLITSHSPLSGTPFVNVFQDLQTIFADKDISLLLQNSNLSTAISQLQGMIGGFLSQPEVLKILDPHGDFMSKFNLNFTFPILLLAGKGTNNPPFTLLNSLFSNDVLAGRIQLKHPNELKKVQDAIQAYSKNHDGFLPTWSQIGEKCQKSNNVLTEAFLDLPHLDGSMADTQQHAASKRLYWQTIEKHVEMVVKKHLSKCVPTYYK